MNSNISSFLFKNVGIRISCTNTTRFYARWTHRKPSKIVLSFESNLKTNLKTQNVIDLTTNIRDKSQQKPTVEQNLKIKQKTNSITHNRSKEIKENKEVLLKKRNFYLSQKKVFNDDGELIYEKLKDNDGRINTLLVKLKSKKERLHTHQMLVEGWRLIVDGLEAKCKLKYVMFSKIGDLDNLRPFLPNTGVQLFKIPYKEMEVWSDVETPPGIFGVFEMPTVENIKRSARPLPLQLICDNIRIPGNLGAILRAAVGVGCDRVLLTKGCVDLWDSKVIRSAAGAHFKQPIYSSVEWDNIESYLPENTSVFVADSNANILEEENSENHMSLPVVPYYGVNFSDLQHVTLIIGGETEGISEYSYNLAASRKGLRLNIPLQKGVDSLNTGMATAVITCEIRKQFIQAWTKLKLQKQEM